MSESFGGESFEMSHGVQPEREISEAERLQNALRDEIEKLLAEMEEFKPKLVYAGFRGGHVVVVVEGHDPGDIAPRPVTAVLVGRPGDVRKLDTTEVSGGSVRVLSNSRCDKAYDYAEPNNEYVIKGVTEGMRGRVAYKIRISEPKKDGLRDAEATSSVYMGKRNMARIEDKERLPLTQFIPPENVVS